MGRRWGRIRGKGTGNKKHSKEAQDKQREVKNSMGNGEAKEFIYTTHGHEIRGGRELWRVGCGTGRRRIRGKKNWDNFSSIINKIYLK